MKPLPLRSGLLVIAAASLGGSALAQPSGENEARALALFNEAVGARERGDYAAACPRFEAAMTLFSSPSTQFNIASCLEHDGKLASAWAAYQRVTVLNRSTKDERRREALDALAAERLAGLQARLPKLRIVVPAAAPPGLKVTDDGQELPAASFGSPLPADPGAHMIVAEARGHRTERRTVTLVEGKVSEVDFALAPEPSVGVPPAAPASAGPPDVDTPGTPWSGQRKAAVVVGAGGVAAMGAAGVLGILTLAKVGTLNTTSCPNGVNGWCTAAAESAKRDARALQTAAFVLLGVGGAVAASGVVLYATAPRTQATPATGGAAIVVSARPSGVSLDGVW